MDPRKALTAMAGARIGIGACLIALPGLAGRAWIGKPAKQVPSKAALRAVGGRDIAIGLGTVIAATRNQPLTGWVVAGALADGSDAVATVAAWDHLPATRLPILVTALATVAAEVALGLQIAASKAPGANPQHPGKLGVAAGREAAGR